LSVAWRLEDLLAGDVVAIEDGPGAVTGDLHRDALAHAGAHHVSHTAPAEVVKELGATTSSATMRLVTQAPPNANATPTRRPWRSWSGSAWLKTKRCAECTLCLPEPIASRSELVGSRMGGHNPCEEIRDLLRRFPNWRETIPPEVRVAECVP